MADLLKHVALVSESSKVTLDALTIVAAALQKQVSRDFGPIWSVDATVNVFPRLEDVPVDYWRIMIMDNIQQQGASGVHMDDQGQPFALVTADDDRDVWSLTTSHECLEMLADPFGNRLVAGDSPKSDQGRVQILVEVADPSEDKSFGYRVNGVLVSDFYTPHFFDPIAADNVQYSFTGAITEPRQVLNGGYMSWVDSETNEWWQETWLGGDSPTFRSLGQLSSSAGSLRSQIDKLTSELVQQSSSITRKSVMAAGHTVSVTSKGSAARAQALRQCIQKLAPKTNQAAAVTGKPNVRRAPRVKKDD